MNNSIYKYLILFINKSSIMVGGQAVIEGVMMRVPGFYATAVRNPSGVIELKRQAYEPLVERLGLSRLPILRGFLHLVDSMRVGFKTLDWSASIAEEQTTSQNALVSGFMTIASIGFTIMIFMGIPYLLTDYILTGTLIKDISINNELLFNVIAGFIRMSCFIIYLYILSKLKDIKTLFQYHGAEHKVVYNFESGKKLTIDNALSFSTKHPRCGTSFVFILMFVTILTYAVTDSFINGVFNYEFSIITRILIHLLFLPLIAGLGYEVLKFLSARQHIFIFSALSKPGLWLQNITTSEPTSDQLEVSLAALITAFGNDKIKEFEGQKYNADAIG